MHRSYCTKQKVLHNHNSCFTFYFVCYIRTLERLNSVTNLPERKVPKKEMKDEPFFPPQNIVSVSSFSSSDESVEFAFPIMES